MLPLQKFQDFIRKHSLFKPEDKILLAVSGGKDSVLMAHLFKLSGFNFGIAHCNFNLRADESQRDELFVKMLAASLDVSFHVTQFATKEFAVKHKVSTQMAARTLRYQWFEEIRELGQYSMTALAQHQDDAIETVLLNLTRGTGIAGLHGILPKRDKLIRPLLFLSARDIAEIIAENHLDFVEDSSNQSTYYARNKIRHYVIPRLKEINPGLEDTFQHNIRRFTDTELVLQQVVANLKEQLFKQQSGKFILSIAKVKTLNPQHLLLFELLRPFNFAEPVVAELLASLDKQSGTAFCSPSHQVMLDRQNLVISPLNEVNPLKSQIWIQPDDSAVGVFDRQLLIHSSTALQYEKHKNKAYVDADKLIFPLVLRSREPGDKFKPIGMNGYKKLSDFFIDEKVPLGDKDFIPILVNGNGEIIWVAGWRQDNRYKLTEATKRVSVFEYQ